MDRDKLMRQARVLQQKKLRRVAQAAKQQRPTVDKGVVKYNAPVPKPSDMKTLSAVPPANKVARSILNPQNIPPQTVQPKKVVKKYRGCAGCRRNINK